MKLKTYNSLQSQTTAVSRTNRPLTMHDIQRAMKTLQRRSEVPPPFDIDSAYRRLVNSMMDSYKYEMRAPVIIKPRNLGKSFWAGIDLGGVDDRSIGTVIAKDDDGLVRVMIGKSQGENMGETKQMSPVIERLVNLAESKGKLQERSEHQQHHINQDQEVIYELRAKVSQLENDLYHMTREKKDFQQGYYALDRELSNRKEKEARAKAKAKKATAKKTVKKSK